MTIDLLDLAEQSTPQTSRLEAPPRPWRIGLVAASAERLLAGRAYALRRLGEEGFEVHVFAPGGPALDALSSASGVLPRPLPRGSGHDPAATLGAFFIVQGALIEQPFLIVHGEGGAMPWLGALAASRAGARAVSTLIDDHALALGRIPASLPAALEPLSGLLAPYASRLHTWLGERSDLYLVTSPDALADARKLGVDPTRIEPLVGADGADHARFHPDVATRDDARAALSIPSSCAHVWGACGALGARRGEREIIETVRLMRDRPDVGVVIAAREGASRALRDALSKLGPRAVLLDGELDRMDLFHRAIDLFVAPRRTTHTPIALHEALATGTPVIALSTAVTRAAIVHGEGGSLVEVADRSALPGRALDLVVRDARLARMSEAAASSSRRRFSRRASHERFLACLESALHAALTR